jgi:tetratricopeptide (TPR) repeat protein
MNLPVIIRNITVLALLACVVSPARAAPPSDQAATSAFEQGVELNKQKQYDRAIAQFTRAVMLSPDTHQYHQALFMTYVATSRGPQAIQFYQGLAKDRPTSAAVHYWLGRLYLQRQSMEDAIREFQAASRLAPQDEHAFISLGHVYLRVGNDAGALTAYRQANRLSPGVAVVHSGLGTIHFNAKDYPNAQQEYETALKIDPSLTEARYNLSLIYEQRGEFARAVKEWQTLLEQDPNESRARERLAAIYFRSEQYDQAVREYATLSQVKQSSPDVFLALGESCILLAATLTDHNEREQLKAAAIQAFQRTLELEPHNPSARRYLDRLTASAPPEEHR